MYINGGMHTVVLQKASLFMQAHIQLLLATDSIHFSGHNIEKLALGGMGTMFTIVT